jgi:hypothetical protein
MTSDGDHSLGIYTQSRAKFPTIEDVEKRIIRAARIEPTENNTHALSAGTPADAWDYPSCSGEYGGILP